MTKPTRMVAGLITGLSFAILAVPLGAQPVPASHSGRVVAPVYDAAHEITVNGTIQMVVTKHTKGSPIGMHLLVTGSKGVLDAHLGPFMSKETREALVAGVPVKLVGAMSVRNHKSYLLVREVTFGDRTVIVRGKHGVLARGQGATARARRSKIRETAKVDLNGGAR